MNHSDLDQRFQFGLEVIREAGSLAHDYFRRRLSLTVKNKGLQDVVSEADLETELLIRNRLSGRFPEDAFLGEETGHSEVAAGQGLWVVDPIDGTQPFVSGLSCWCVSIAFMAGDTLQFGMVYAPARDELFAGGIGFPATLNGQPVARHTGTRLTEGLTGVGFAPRQPSAEFLAMLERFLATGGVFHREGSGALGLCYVAGGMLLGFIERHMWAWDCLGAMAIIKAAGLQTNDFLADDGLHRGNRVIAGVPQVYRALEALYDAPPG